MQWQSADGEPVREGGLGHSGADSHMAGKEEVDDRHQAAWVEVVADSYPGEEGGVDMGRPHVEDPRPLSARAIKDRR